MAALSAILDTSFEREQASINGLRLGVTSYQWSPALGRLATRSYQAESRSGIKPVGPSHGLNVPHAGDYCGGQVQTSPGQDCRLYGPHCLASRKPEFVSALIAVFCLGLRGQERPRRASGICWQEAQRLLTRSSGSLCTYRLQAG